MTKAQRKVFDAIVQYLGTRGCSPSYADIALAVGSRSLATVYKHVSHLELGGYLRFEDCMANRKARSMQLTKVGAKAAGKTLEFGVSELLAVLDDKDKRIAELERQISYLRGSMA